MELGSETNSSIDKYWSKIPCVDISWMACCKTFIGESLAKVVVEFSPITIFQPVRVFQCSSAKLFSAIHPQFLSMQQNCLHQVSAKLLLLKFIMERKHSSKNTYRRFLIFLMCEHQQRQNGSRLSAIYEN